MQTKQKTVKLSKGQINPALTERFDIELMNSSAQEVTNMYSTVYGGLKARQGNIITQILSDAFSFTDYNYQETSPYWQGEPKTGNNPWVTSYGVADISLPDMKYIDLKGLCYKEQEPLHIVGTPSTSGGYNVPLPNNYSEMSPLTGNESRWAYASDNSAFFCEFKIDNATRDMYVNGTLIGKSASQVFFPKIHTMRKMDWSNQPISVVVIYSTLGESIGLNYGTSYVFYCIEAGLLGNPDLFSSPAVPPVWSIKKIISRPVPNTTVNAVQRTNFDLVFIYNMAWNGTTDRNAAWFVPSYYVGGVDHSNWTMAANYNGVKRITETATGQNFLIFDAEFCANELYLTQPEFISNGEIFDDNIDRRVLSSTGSVGTSLVPVHLPMVSKNSYFFKSGEDVLCISDYNNAAHLLCFSPSISTSVNANREANMILPISCLYNSRPEIVGRRFIYETYDYHFRVADYYISGNALYSNFGVSNFNDLYLDVSSTRYSARVPVSWKYDFGAGNFPTAILYCQDGYFIIPRSVEIPVRLTYKFGLSSTTQYNITLTDTPTDYRITAPFGDFGVVNIYLPMNRVISFNQVLVSLNDASALADLRVETYQFNSEETYLLILSNNQITFYDKLGETQVGSSLAVDYSNEDIKDIDFTYNENYLVFTHEKYEPMVIVYNRPNGTTPASFRVGSSGTIKNIPFDRQGGFTNTAQDYVCKIDLGALNGNTTAKITGLVGADGVTVTPTTQWPAGSLYIDGGKTQGGLARIIDVSPAQDLVQTRNVSIALEFFGFGAGGANLTLTVKAGYEPVWSGAPNNRGWPIGCLFYAQRLWFMGSPWRPSTIWASRIDDHFNFLNSSNYDNDSISLQLSSDTTFAVQRAIGNRGIQIFTTGDEWYVPETSNFTPTGLVVVKNSHLGLYEKVKPVIVDTATFFVERSGRSMQSALYSNEQRGLAVSSLTLLTDLINQPKKMTATNFSETDIGNFVYMCLKDGTVICGTIIQSQEIFAFSKFVTNNRYLDVTASGDYVFYIIENNHGIFLVREDKNCVTDCTMIVEDDDIAGGQIISNIDDNFIGAQLMVYSDTKNYGMFTVAPSADGTTGEIDLGEAVNDSLKIGIPFEYRWVSNPIAVNSMSQNIDKRIAKMTVVTKDTSTLIIQNQELFSPDDRYDVYGATEYRRNCYYTIKGQSPNRANILSVQMNINYGDK